MNSINTEMITTDCQTPDKDDKNLKKLSNKFNKTSESELREELEDSTTLEKTNGEENNLKETIDAKNKEQLNMVERAAESKQNQMGEDLKIIENITKFSNEDKPPTESEVHNIEREQDQEDIDKDDRRDDKDVNGPALEQQTEKNRNETILKNNIQEDGKKSENVAAGTEEVVEFEDVEIPEEVDELILPDEAEFSNDKDDIDKSFTDEETTKYSEAEEDSEVEETTESIVETTEKRKNKLATPTEEVEGDDEEENDKNLLNEEHPDENNSKDLAEEDINNVPIEPELIAIEDDNECNASSLEENNTIEKHPNDDDTNCSTINDPLNCTDNQQHEEVEEVHEVEESNNHMNESAENYENKDLSNNDVEAVDVDDDEDEDEDDEVEFVETRDSPICIESDDDDNDSYDKKYKSNNINIRKNVNNSKPTIITTSSATIVVPKNIIVTRTSARKSTAKSQQQQAAHTTYTTTSPSIVPKIQNINKNFTYLQKATNYKHTSTKSTQRIVDCIELLDSSDEEISTSSSSSRHQNKQHKTPQKRTLLAAKGNYYKNYSNKNASTSNRLPNNFSSQTFRQQAKKPAPPPLPPPTPQSNFLNAVQLQPAAATGANPPAFSALLSNKSVIIPNAFYGNPPSVRGTPDTELDRRYARWLENFLHQFCKPQFVATHSCFVFLQRALKYKDFVRIKAIRTNMNMHARTASDHINSHLMVDLRTILMKNSKEVTAYGRRFCDLVCSSVNGKTVTLMAHGISGKVTLKTCNMDASRATTNSPISSMSSTSTNSSNALTRKRQLDEDEDEYTPERSKIKTKIKALSETEDSGDNGEDRKRSLRTKRTKRLDDSFSYNEDDLLAEYEIDDEEETEKLAQAQIQRKIDQKRLEAQKQREQQVKSFESAFIQAFARPAEGPTTSSKTEKNATNQRIRFRNTTVATATCIKQYTANNDAEDLLQATWIENLENDDTQIISDDEEPKEHRIYKQQQLKQQQQQQQQHFPKIPVKFSSVPNARFAKSSKKNHEEIITGDDDYSECNYIVNNNLNAEVQFYPKNVDPHMYVNGKNKDKCIICNLSCQRLVHHYVNEHRGCEVYNSRLSSIQLQLLKQSNCNVSSMSMYKNGQPQYEAYCIFCQKQSRFMLPYWFQHFTMHTGEYAYRCTGCGVRKPTRSLLTQHHSQGCPEDGSVVQDYSHDSKSLQVDARLCTLCNYVQLHRNNIVKHLHQQHNIKQILPKHIQTIVLLKIPNLQMNSSSTLASLLSSSSSSSPSTSTSAGAYVKRVKVPTSYNQAASCSYNEPTYIIDDDDNDLILPEEDREETETNSENQYYNYIPPYMQAAVNAGNFTFEDVDNGDDLSFMICGMLDVQMNPESN